MVYFFRPATILTLRVCRVAFFPASRRPNHPFALRIMLPPGTTTDADVMVQDPEAVKRLVMDIIERKDIELGDFTYLTVYRLVRYHQDTQARINIIFRAHARMVDSFSNGGRVFLAGDAAHCHSPMGSQGLNSSMQDSVSRKP
jgi:2-polyprenyl-6-methoxyphenol hydroxylase-like FAD-dependent oxidoreductase